MNEQIIQSSFPCFEMVCLLVSFDSNERDIFAISSSIWFSLFNGISTFVGYLIPKPYLIHSWEDKEVHTLSES